MSELPVEGARSQVQTQTFRDIQVDGDGNTLTINQIIQVAENVVRTYPFLFGSPYVGLQRFEEDSKDLFFGRDELISQLLRAVRPFASGSVL